MNHLVRYTGVELHRNNIVVLKDVNLQIASGELVYLTGKVGSGKSSLLKSLYAEIPIASGHAEVLGRDMSIIRRREIPYLRREIGIVFQDFRLLSDRSVYDNLMFVLDATGWKNQEEKVERIQTVLSEVGMLNKSYKMPLELSGGEQQRVVMARAMLNNPKLILADEPTGNLDPETGSRIMKRFHEIAESGTAVIIATHNHSLLKQYPSRQIQCQDRHILEL